MSAPKRHQTGCQQARLQLLCWQDILQINRIRSRVDGAQDIDADADHTSDRLSLPSQARLTEHTTKLATGKVEVVRPLDLDAKGELLANPSYQKCSNPEWYLREALNRHRLQSKGEI